MWVIVFDYGLNGAWVHEEGYETEAEAEAVVSDGLPYMGGTGYGGTSVVEVTMKETS